MKKTVILFTLVLFIISCGEKVREEITERYENGQKKLLVIYKGEGSKEVIVERITYGSRGDTLYWEKPLEDFYYEKVREEIRERYDNGDKKLLVKYKGEGVDEVIIERITYSKSGDTLILENTLDKMKMVREYYRNGQIEKEKNYKDGELDGKWILYYENGQIRNERNYKDGEKDGKQTYYYENGQIEEEGNYKDWKEVGKWTSYYENGQIFGEGNYKDGKRDGKWTTYNEDGSIKEVKEY